MGEPNERGDRTRPGGNSWEGERKKAGTLGRERERGHFRGLHIFPASTLKLEARTSQRFEKGFSYLGMGANLNLVAKKLVSKV